MRGGSAERLRRLQARCFETRGASRVPEVLQPRPGSCSAEGRSAAPSPSTTAPEPRCCRRAHLGAAWDGDLSLGWDSRCGSSRRFGTRGCNWQTRQARWVPHVGDGLRTTGRCSFPKGRKPRTDTELCMLRAWGRGKGGPLVLSGRTDGLKVGCQGDLPEEPH